MAEASPAMEIGQKLVDWCNQGDDNRVIDQLYDPQIVSVEAMADPMPREQVGIEAIRAKQQWWYDNHEIHDFKATGPFPHDDRFIVVFDIDVTAKAGPMDGQRMQMQEAALYTVKGDKIVREEFFYAM